jgi:hypothetical protein
MTTTVSDAVDILWNAFYTRDVRDPQELLTLELAYQGADPTELAKRLVFVAVMAFSRWQEDGGEPLDFLPSVRVRYGHL